MIVFYAKDHMKQQYVFRSTLKFSAEQRIDCLVADTSTFDYKKMTAMKVSEVILNNPKLKLRGIDRVYRMKSLFNSYKNDIKDLNPLLFNMFKKLEVEVDGILREQEIEVEEVELKWSDELSREINSLR